MSSIITILSNSNVQNYHSVRFGGVSGVTLAMGVQGGKVVAFWSDRGNALSQTVLTFGSVSELAKLPEAFKASTGLAIGDVSLRKLASHYMPVLSTAQAPTAPEKAAKPSK